MGAAAGRSVGTRGVKSRNLDPNSGRARGARGVEPDACTELMAGARGDGPDWADSWPGLARGNREVAAPTAGSRIGERVELSASSALIGRAGELRRSGSVRIVRVVTELVTA